MQHILIHVEPLAHCLNAGVARIEAAAFNLDPCNITHTYKESIALSLDLIDQDFCFDIELVKNYIEESVKTLRTQPPAPFYYALCRLSREFDWGKATVWANLANNELALLENAYAAYGCDAPWKLWQKMDTQTLRKLSPYLPDYRKKSELALEDRVAQLARSLERLGESDE